MEHIIGRYQNSTETQNPEDNDPQLVQPISFCIYIYIYIDLK